MSLSNSDSSVFVQDKFVSGHPGRKEGLLYRRVGARGSPPNMNSCIKKVRLV